MKAKTVWIFCMAILIPAAACDRSGDVWVETSRSDFADGIFDGGGNLYASARGDVQLIPSWDVNGDGWLDIVFSDYASDDSYNIDSDIFWGSPRGFHLDSRTSLPTHACIAHAIADLDNDGFIDIVFSSWQNKDHDLKEYDPESSQRFFGSDSLIYWGGAWGPDKRRFSEFYTFAPTGMTVADLDNDGFLDIIVASSSTQGVWIYKGSEKGYAADEITRVPAPRSMLAQPADLNHDGFLDLIVGNLEVEAPSRIYFGGKEGYSPDRSQELLTSFVRSIAVADLDGDSHLDIIFANGRDRTSFLTDSFIYWGAEEGYSERRRTRLPTMLAMQAAVGDLNSDGFLDIVFANGGNGTRYDISSFIYYGSPDGFAVSHRLEMPTCGAHSVALADYDRNGELDLAFSSMCDPEGKTSDHESILYYQRNGRFELADICFPTHDGHHNTNRDLGNIYDRKYRDVYISSLFDAGRTVTWTNLEWDGQVPAGCSIKLSFRCGDGGIDHENWIDTHNGAQILRPPRGRYCQYRAEFLYDGSGRPKLEAARLYYK